MKYFYTLFWLNLILIGCSDIFIEDLTDKKVNLKTPSNGYLTSKSKVTFLWEKMKDIEYYRLQVVTGTFESMNNAVLDTNINSNEFTSNLDVDTYYWCVTAYNASGQAYSDTFKIQIDSSANISEQEVLLVKPVRKYFSVNNVNVEWQPIHHASAYKIEVRENKWDDNRIDTSIIETTNSHQIVLSEGSYTIGIQAIQGQTFTKFSKKELIIDMTSPETPNLLSPTNQEIVKDSIIKFNWDHFDFKGVKVDTIWISSNENFSKSSTSTYSVTEKSSYEVTISSPAIYYWKVQSSDFAGNSSKVSQTQRFEVSF